MPGGPGFVDTLRAAWDAGDAVLPLDPTAPARHTAAVIEALRPTAIVESDGERRHLDGDPVEPGDALVVATSGTTGAPKGAIHTHRGVEAAAFATAVAAGVTADARWLACLPLSHVGGLSVVTRALLTGSGLEVIDRADPAAIDDAARRGATHVSLVPTVLTRIDPTPWHTILLGGSAIPGDRPSNTIATYGMTETFGGVVYDGHRLPSVEVRILEPDAEGPGPDGDGPGPLHEVTTRQGTPRLARPGVVGPIELRTPTLCRAYRNGVAPVDAAGWYATGDLGALDAETGRLVVHGRGDDLIISGGEKVWPTDVEAVLGTDPGVAEVAVVGRPDAEWGQRVVAVVVPSDPSAPPTLDRLRELVRAALPVAAAPKELELIDSLPRTGLGKIRRSVVATAAGSRNDG